MSNAQSVSSFPTETQPAEPRPAPLTLVVARGRESGLPDDVRHQLSRLIQAEGLNAVARVLDMSPSTVASAAAGCGVRKANRMLLTQRLHAFLAER
ncbi:MAG: hypothetical protein JWP97_5392 [Labilithrix sp.]|nr:hypothetical protein [Labilithrix sp.]